MVSKKAKETVFVFKHLGQSGKVAFTEYFQYIPLPSHHLSYFSIGMRTIMRRSKVDIEALDVFRLPCIMICVMVL